MGARPIGRTFRPTGAPVRPNVRCLEFMDRLVCYNDPAVQKEPCDFLGQSDWMISVGRLALDSLIHSDEFDRPLDVLDGFWGVSVCSGRSSTDRSTRCGLTVALKVSQ